MADDNTEEQQPRSRAVQRAIAQHGEDVKEYYDSALLDVAVRALVPLFFVAIFVAVAVVAVLTSGWMQWAALAWLVLTARFTWRCVRGLWMLLRSYGYVALVYEDRLVLQHGKQFEVVRWDEVEAVYVHTLEKGEVFYPPGYPDKLYFAVVSPLMYFWNAYTDLVLRDGSRLRIHSAICMYDDLAGTIQGEVTGQLFPKFRARFNAGETLRFGPITVHQDALEIGLSKVKWIDHFCTYRVDGYLISADNIDNNAIGDYLPMSDIPNAVMVAHLINEISGRFPKFDADGNLLHPEDDIDPDDRRHEHPARD